MSINHAAISGNLTRDPELRVTQAGTSVLSFGVAVNDRRRNPQTEQWEDVPNFIDCVVFGRRAESLADMMRKGAKVAVSGSLRQSSWEDRATGQRRSKVEVVADQVELMSGGGERRRQAAPAPAHPVHDDEIPF